MSTAQTRFEELLPFYLNGTISAQDRAFIDEYLGQVPQAAQSLVFLQSLRDTVKAEVVAKPQNHQVQNMLRRWSATQPATSLATPTTELGRRRSFSWHWLSGGFAFAIAALLVMVIMPQEQGVLHLDSLDGKPDLELRLASGVTPDHAAVQDALEKSNAVVLAQSEQDGRHRLTLDLDARARTQSDLIEGLTLSGHLDGYTLLASD